MFLVESIKLIRSSEKRRRKEKRLHARNFPS
jgi:hypothetical protein